MSQRMLQRGRYPKVSQSQQQSESQLGNQWTSLPPLQQAGVPHQTSDGSFYNTQQNHLQSQSVIQNGQSVLSPGNWASSEATSQPQTSLQQQPLLSQPPSLQAQSNWQTDTTYTYSQANQNDPWNWNIDNNERNLSQQYQNWQESDSWKGHHQQPLQSSVEASMEPPQHYTEQLQNQLQYPVSISTTQSYFQAQGNVNTTAPLPPPPPLQQPWRYNTPEQPFQEHRTDQQKFQEPYQYREFLPYPADRSSWSGSSYSSENWYQQQHPKVHPSSDLHHGPGQPSISDIHHGPGQPSINPTWDTQEWEQWPTSVSQDNQQQECHSLLDEHSSNVMIANTLESQNKLVTSTQNSNLPPDADVAKDLNNRPVENVIPSDLMNDNVQNHPVSSSDLTGAYNIQEGSAVHPGIIQDSDGGGLSAFFNNDVQEQITTSENVNTCIKLTQTNSFTQEEAVTSVQEDSISSSVECCEQDQNIKPDSEVDSTLRDTLEENVGQKRGEFLQSEEDDSSVAQHRMEVLGLNSESCLEEPVNQEVPEPPPESVINSNQHNPWPHQAATQLRGMEYKDEHIHTPVEEPINQQVPENTVEAVSQEDCISSPQHDRVIIRAREGSPFKPPSKQSSIRGLVVQQEVSPEDVLAPSLSSENTTQDVNLETVPDNLERLPDAEITEEQQLQQQHYSSWHNALHRHHGREQYNNSPSTTLWDSPDIPSVTLAPAAPPFPPSPTHSSDKSNQGSIHQGGQQKDSPSQSGNEDNVCTLRQSPLGREELTTYPLSGVQGQPLSKNKDQGVVIAQPAPCPPPPPAIALELLQKTSPLGTKHTPQLIKPSKSISPVPHDLCSQNQPSDIPIGKTDTLTETTSVPSNTAQHHKTSHLITENKQESLSTGKDKENTNTTKESPKDQNVYTDRNSTVLGQRPREDRIHSSQESTEWWGKDNQKGSGPEGGHRGNRSFSAGIDGSPLHSNRTEYRENWDRRHQPRHHYEDRRYTSYDDRSYFDQERSRPSSRTSLNESVDGQERFVRDRDYRRRYYPERESTPSRLSESDILSKQRERPDHYESDSYDERYQRGYRREDYYNHHRNYVGYAYDPYKQDHNPYYSYYNPYGYGYSSYNYGFYDELYRYNRQLEEHYHQYQSAYAAEYEKMSVHSGRSSVNDELQKNSSSLKYSRDTDQSSIGGSEYSVYNQQYLVYGEDSAQHSRAATTPDQEPVPQPAVRLTPTKFSSPHTVASFSKGGLLIKVVPRQTSTQPSAVEIHSLQQTLDDETFQEFKLYPGPLIREKTHKNDVVQFCQKKIQEVKERPDVPDRDSCILLWELMILLLRQNGTVAGSDIAELLLKDHEVLRPPIILPRLAADTPQGEGVLPDLTDPTAHTSSGDTPSPDEGIVVSQDKTVINSHAMSVEKVTRKFREFLLFGHKKDALEWAMKHTLWGHALFLASKMDSRTYANVIVRFANSLALNDPLQTLYQLMSGRQPSAVTCVADEKWGDWRPHLAMVLSNPSARPEVDARSVTTLGDTLASRGCLYAAHFCYLMAQVEFGSYSSKSSKLVLLGSNHLNLFEEFATNEAIQCSEIYEYAQSLANPDYVLPHLQAYKFIYATRLAEYGFTQEALHYCEIVSSAFQKMYGLFPLGLITQVYELANKLKYYDPHFTQGPGELEELEDPVWLLNLRNHMQAISDNKVMPSVYSNASVTASVPGSDANESLAYVPFENMGYQSNAFNQGEAQQYYNQQEGYQGYSWTGQGGEQQDENCRNEQDTAGQFQQFTAQTQSNTSHWGLGNEQKNSSYRNNESSIHGVTQPPLSTDNSDYYGASTQIGHSTRQQLRDRQDSVSSDGTYRDRRDSTMSTGSGHAKMHTGSIPPAPSSIPPPNRKILEENKKTDKKDDKTKTAGGWLNGIFSKILPKAPNQMILPDDKNPTIIWDSVKQKWVNTEDDENDESGKSIAPPTDMELMGKVSHQDNQSSNSLGNAPPPSGHNRFQRTKSKGMRQNYVDVLNPRGTKMNTAPPPEVLFPSVDTLVSPETKLFAPSSVPDHEDRPTDYVSSGQPFVGVPPPEEEHNQVTSQMPPMFDPAEFASSRMNADSHRTGSNVLNRRAYPT